MISLNRVKIPINRHLSFVHNGIRLIIYNKIVRSVYRALNILEE